MEEIAFAKINLALHVRQRAEDGYHAIETLFAFASDGDRLRVGEGDRLSLESSGPFAAALGSCDDNLVLRAARALQDRYAVARGAALRLDKRLPVASGIGGGSADAAATLRLLVRWWGLPFEEEVLLDIAATLGADVPACVRSRTAFGSGRGDRLEPLEGLEEAALGAPWLLLVNPGAALSTRTVFAGWDGVDRGPLGADPAGWRNDLEASACNSVPAIALVLDRLAASPGLSLARMSGSGATCFGLFRSADSRDRAQAAIAASNPDWWTFRARLR